MNDQNSEEPRFYGEWLELYQSDQEDMYNEIYNEQFFHSFDKIISEDNVSINIENNDLTASSKDTTSKKTKSRKQNQNKCSMRRKKYSVYDENTQQTPNHINNVINRIGSLKEFIEYLNYKINKDKKIKVTKNELKILYQQLKMQLPFSELTRDEKRSKDKLFEKLYSEYSNIVKFLEKYPQQFLEPVFLFQDSRIKSRKRWVRKDKTENEKS